MDNIQLSLFGRTYPELFQVTAERILEPCLKKSQTPIFQCLQVANGQPQEWLEGGRLTQLGESLMLNIGEYPNVENESTLSEILEDNVPEKYYLSPKACLGILRRAKSKGRKLPDNLRIALEQKVAEGGGRFAIKIAGTDTAERIKELKGRIQELKKLRTEISKEIYSLTPIHKAIICGFYLQRRITLEEKRYALMKQKISGEYDVDPDTGEIDDSYTEDSEDGEV